jgi:hypothetical protein
MKRRPYNPQFAAPIKSRRDRLDEAVERDNQVAARRTREYEAAQARETLPGADDNIVCAVPPAGWHCTRNAGHSGPCAAHPAAPEAPASAPVAPHASAEMIPQTAEDVIAFIGNHYSSMDDSSADPLNIRFELTVHDLQSAFFWWFDDALYVAPAAPHAQAEPENPTYMDDKQAYEWAWAQVKLDVGTKGWTAGEHGNYFGFFLHGWSYGKQYERQGTTAAPVPQEAEQAAPAAVTDERARFEAWAAGNVTSLVQGKFGTGYVYSDAISAWKAWQARAALAQPAAPAVTEAEQASVLAAREWMPIASVPMDGSEILLYLGEPYNQVVKARWFDIWKNWIEGEFPDPQDEYCGIGSRVPTHWMPLPDAPATTKG